MTNVTQAELERARVARDPRFDGRFFLGVHATGIYCRPICPVQPRLGARSIAFYKTAAAASDAGLRPCLRCRPECAPTSSLWRGTEVTVSRALALIEAGEFESGEAEQFAGRLGVGERQLRRLFKQHLGTTPGAVARTRRLHQAKRMIDETDLPIHEIAGMVGFGSVRRLNEVTREVWQRSPTELRKLAQGAVVATPSEGQGFRLSLSYRGRYPWSQVLRYLGARSCPGVERVEDEGQGTYLTRTFRVGEASGILQVRHRNRRLQVDVNSSVALDAASLLKLASRIRRMFDLEANPKVIRAGLKEDPMLESLLEAWPAVRVPGAFNPFEVAVRAVLGQQVSVKGATTLAGRLVERFGEPAAAQGDWWLFPLAEQLSKAPVEAIGIPGKRADALRAVASFFCAPGSSDLELLRKQLLALPGIGPWTTEYVLMRCFADPDAFPSGDLVLQKRIARAAGGNEERWSQKRLDRRAASWKPWRSYAAMLLWWGH